ATAQRRYKAATYSGFSFPNPAGSGLTSDSVGYYMFAGLGAPPSPPDAAPALISPGASITPKWGSAERATTYWLQVNTQSDFNGTNLFNAEVGNVTTQEVTGPSLGITYYCRVKAGNASGWGPWSSVSSVLANTMP
ncbi:MAG: fibronectin type III domain-containing protein, partial [Dehalococcoidia bacterium]